MFQSARTDGLPMRLEPVARYLTRSEAVDRGNRGRIDLIREIDTEIDLKPLEGQTDPPGIVHLVAPGRQ